MKKTLSLCGALLVATSAPAWANWQYTRWGMSSDEVFKAAKGRAVAIPESEQPAESTVTTIAKLTSTFSYGRFSFHVFFRFDRETGGLSQVVLSLDSSADCRLLKQSLADEYGKPVREDTLSVTSTAEWRDEKQANGVYYLFMTTPECSVIYSPIDTAE
jgi:hypothetical protein